jgi:hypothetical protein
MRLTEGKKVSALRELAKHIQENKSYTEDIDGISYEVDFDDREGVYSVEAGGSERKKPVVVGMIYPTMNRIEVYTKQGWKTYPIQEPATAQAAHNN